MNCLFCSHLSEDFYGIAFKCPQCSLVFKNPSEHLNEEEDFRRYSLHQNNSADPGYVNFLNKLLGPLAEFLPEKFCALDFGCGPGPTLSRMMEEKGGTVFNYDPIFHKNDSLLNDKYDVVTATEVVEHFKTPDLDWEKLVGLVAPGGLLAIMTQFLGSAIDYHKWWYKNDPTHVVFYNEKTFQFLADKFQLEKIFDDKNSVIIFRKKR